MEQSIDTSIPTSVARPSLIERLRVARWLWMPLFLVVVTRIGIAFVVLFAMPILPQNATMTGWHVDAPNQLLDTFGARWDTGFYLSIVDEGYKFQGVEFPSIAFFPLLPLMMQFTKTVTGVDTMTAGLLVTNLSLCIAAVLFYRLVMEEFGNDTADRAIWYWLIFPASLFGSAIYTESVFAMVAIGALYFARKGFWESAGMLGIAGTLTRLVGVIVAPLLVVEWFVQWRKRDTEKPTPWWGIFAGLLTPVGTLLYMGYLWMQFGDPLAFVKASEAWAREPKPIWETLQALLVYPNEGWIAALLAGNLHVNDWFDFLIVAFFVVMGLVLLYKRRWSEAIFVLLGALIPLNSGLLMSQRRYMWVLFPVFIVLGQWGAKTWVDRLITTVSLVALAIFTILFAEWYWVA